MAKPTYKGVAVLAAREEEAKRRQEERDWPIRCQRRMEEALRALGLPRRAWEQIELVATPPYSVDKPLETYVVLSSPRTRRNSLTRRVLYEPDREDNQRAYWAAAAARVAHQLPSAQTPFQGFLLGRLLEQSVAWFDNPGKQSAAALRRSIRDWQIKGGRGKKGKLLPHNELIRRALVFDPGKKNWLDNPPQHRKLRDILKLLEDRDTQEELIAGGDLGPSLPITDVLVKRDEELLEVHQPGGKDRLILFRTLAETIAKLKKTAR